METLGTLNDIGRRNISETDQKDAIWCQQIFNHSSLIWLIIDEDTGSIVEANAAAAEFYGYSIKELKSMKIFQVNLGMAENSKESMTSEKSNSDMPIFLKHKLKSGLIRDVQVYSSPFQINDRILLSSIIIDVTSSRQAEAELQKSRDRLALVVEATNAGIWEWDVANRRLSQDSRCKAMLGYAEHEVGDFVSEWQNLCHPDDITHIKQAADKYLAGTVDRYDVECRLQHKDGSYRWIRSTAKILYDHDKQPISWVGSYLDITDSNRMEELQKEHALKLRDFIQVVSDVSFIIDEDGRYIEVFGNDEDMFPTPRQSMPGLTLFDVVPHEQASKILEEIRIALSSQETQSFKNVMHLPKGKRILVARMALMNYIVDGKRTVAISIVDVTEQEKARDMLQACYELRRRSDVLNDLLNGTRSADEETMAYIKSMGLDFSLPLFCCVINLGTAAADKSRQEINSVDLQEIQDVIINELNGVKGCITWGCRGKVGVLFQTTHSAQNHKNRSMQLAGCLQEKIIEYYPDMALTIGIGEIQKGLKGFGESFQQAWEAITASRCRNGSYKEIIHFRDLGIFQLLSEQSGQKRATEYIATTIGKLISYDNEKGTNYLDTLDVILKCANLKEAAQMLFLHHNTLVFRKRRIEEMLGVSINDFETKLTLASAIKLYRLKSLE